MEKVAGRPESLTDENFHYCPGCTHGITHRLVAEVLDEFDVREETIGIAPVGCSVLAYDYFDCDFQVAAHGRAPAVATGVKRVHPDKTVFTYQGDGDLASIGTAETVHAANRGENITIIFINNAIYGMTGGQMAPTTLENQKTTTTQTGRNKEKTGNPIRMTEMLAELDGPAYLARVSMHDSKNIRKSRKAIKKAFRLQHEKKGFTMVEVLSTCPTNWGADPKKAMKWLEENMLPKYELGIFKDIEEVE
ncbi:thiamine pyrophosphate-dependent enzyme [Halarsenatibacter silvermanii]|uniref:2-oxoglutarate ferredoxin oxidoreductase subunit beta n=1 Tax=Halarsenatibacter silvermanii TaxID=321763 RepID=A0A1G9PJL1_9FIRM|nr:thiamine pyrophosphate-dependent enzyme [Halarsenatibacter silvermanii]SDL98904.1 2-oxoglutarate ferredoxin oxidoreductase subunit beta [Halarsenatibacter silvermanii]